MARPTPAETPDGAGTFLLHSAAAGICLAGLVHSLLFVPAYPLKGGGLFNCLLR